GARAGFAMIPQNLAARDAGADYIVSGYWSQQAAGEASRYCRVNVAASSEAGAFTSLPVVHSEVLDKTAAYVYLTSNETIQGVEYQRIPDEIQQPLVCDMTSNLLTGRVDVRRYGLIFAGTQKNLGTAGLCVVIIRRELLGRARAETPSIFDFTRQARADSLLNTPPVITWYVLDRVLAWLQEQGGVEAMAGVHAERSQRLYRVIDESGLFSNPVDPGCRSRVNIPFTINNEQLSDAFLQGARDAGLLALEGHKSAGGFRASIYNAMPTEGVDLIIDFIRSFAQARA
ncbi:MAG: 3-phosphoserine/phosphohydroxythreonine transaminase, partial [Thiotrichales bacterium]|nr:3-phosphoserine/phosphohydroxythreonine transaminase [Thiotrichales bacterium]